MSLRDAHLGDGPLLETARLWLRPYTLDDLDELAVILSNPEVMKHSPRGPIAKEKAKAVTQEILESFINHWQQHSFGVWAVLEKVTHKLLGHKHQLSPHNNVGGDLGFTYLGYTTKDSGISQNYAAAMVGIKQVQGLELQWSAGLGYQPKTFLKVISSPRSGVSKETTRGGTKWLRLI